jgi:carbamoyl-phosphate synthase small subunit
MTAVNPLPVSAILALADGTLYRGRAFGAPVVGAGEVVFNTSITGYQEILTDPSYAGQIVTMTYPQIGNVGVNPEDEESSRPFLQGFVAKEVCEVPSNWRSRESLDDYMRRHAIPGIAGIDTRALVRRIRDHGTQVGVLSADPAQQDAAALVARARDEPGLDGRDLVAEVTCDAPYRFDEGLWPGVDGQLPRPERPVPRYRLVAYDFGIKRNILRLL